MLINSVDRINLPPVSEVYKFLISFSGGKDSLCLLLWAIANLPLDKLEIVHQKIDGQDESGFMDYPITTAYVKAIAEYFGLPLYFSWLDGGFEGELMRTEAPRRPTYFETAEEGLKSSGGRGKANTRRRFPAKVADLRTRWCSGALKIDVCRASIINQERFADKTIVVLTGERREESPQRSRYEPTVEYLRSTKKGRSVFQHRPILGYTLTGVWRAIENAKILPHPAYYWGAPRLSCRSCIFGTPDHFASLRRDFPKAFDRLARLERELNHTIDSRYSLNLYADRGTPYSEANKFPGLTHRDTIELLDATLWDVSVFSQKWFLPAPAFSSQVSGPP